MKKCFQIFFLFICYNSICQSRVTIESVQKIFNESQIKKNERSYNYKSWKFNNADSLYFKIDTLTGIIYKSGKYKSLCKAVDWTFYRKNKFTRGEESICNEYGSRSITKFPDDYFSIVIYSVESETIIDVLRNDRMIVESFKVTTLETNEEYNKITLVRRFNSYH